MNSAHGLERLRKAFGYSMKGLLAGWRHEEAFRQELILTVVLLPLTFVIGSNFLEYAILLATLLLVLITELFNSAIEALTDRVGTEHHELSGRAKDLSSAAVFLALVLLAVVWGAVAWARFAG
ncbi:MAG: diacylglycerol kinase [Gammaproteobacteria bacterium]|jgi:diacylglycerol kinase (ATP)